MNDSAFEQQSRRLWQKAYDASRSQGADGMQAEDIAQEVMLRLWQMRHDLDRYQSPEMLARLMGKRLTINLLRRKNAISLDSQSLMLTTSDRSPQELLEEEENSKWLEQRLRTLPDHQYAILYMRQVEQRSYKEIASLLGFEVSSVRTLLSRARKALLEALRKRR